MNAIKLLVGLGEEYGQMSKNVLNCTDSRATLSFWSVPGVIKEYLALSLWRSGGARNISFFEPEVDHIPYVVTHFHASAPYFPCQTAYDQVDWEGQNPERHLDDKKNKRSMEFRYGISEGDIAEL